MDPRFRRNHQLHLLLKRRTYVSDHELYEMMRSKQVFRAQNELRRDLEKRLQEIKLDRKVKIASSKVQRSTFIKLMAAREKGLRHLFDVKKYIGEKCVKSEDDAIDLSDSEQENVHLSNENEHFKRVDDIYVDNADVLRSDEILHPLHEDQDAYVIQSVNTEWMEDIVKKCSDKEHLQRNEKNNLEFLKSNADKRVMKEKERKSHFSKESLSRDRPTRSASLENISCKISNNESPNPISGKIKVRPASKSSKLKIRISECGERKETESSSTQDKPYDTEEPDKVDISVPLSECETNSKRHENQDGVSISKTHNGTFPSPLSVQRNLQPLPPIFSDNKTSALLEIPKAAPLPKIPHLQERERSVTMLFVEDSDDDDDDILSKISTFDIEAFIKHHRRKRGYSVIISSTNLQHIEDKHQNTAIKTEDKKMKDNSIKHPHHPSSWGVKFLEEISPRQRSNQWYQNFMKTKKLRKRHNKTIQSSSDSEQKDVPSSHHHRWKTPSSSDSQPSPDLQCQVKLQRLKLHSQSLNRRVAVFVST